MASTSGLLKNLDDEDDIGEDIMMPQNRLFQMKLKSLLAKLLGASFLVTLSHELPPQTLLQLRDAFAYLTCFRFSRQGICICS